MIAAGLVIPQRFSMPVQQATQSDYNQKSFWFYPWGMSGTHKGVDIFAKKGTVVTSATAGFVLYTGTLEVGGNVAVVLGPKWRLHYYAHLDTVTTSVGWVSREEPIGTVGDSGNAKGKPAHLHYAIATIIPYFWKVDSSPQGWKKMFYLNPIPALNRATS